MKHARDHRKRCTILELATWLLVWQAVDKDLQASMDVTKIATQSTWCGRVRVSWGGGGCGGGGGGDWR